MMQQVAVFAIVVLAAVYAAWKFLPRALLGRLVRAAVARARRSGSISEEETAALVTRLTASSCGACDSCGTCGPAAAPKEPAKVSFVPGALEAQRLPQKPPGSHTHGTRCGSEGNE